VKQRAWRITIGAAVLAVVLVAALVVANWGTVRDHVEAWHFQLTSDTVALDPHTPLCVPESSTPALQILSTYANCSVVLERKWQHDVWGDQVVVIDVIYPWESTYTADMLLRELRRRGCRVLEQRFPIKAYVVIGRPFAYRATVRGGR